MWRDTQETQTERVHNKFRKYIQDNLTSYPEEMMINLTDFPCTNIHGGQLYSITDLARILKRQLGDNSSVKTIIFDCSSVTLQTEKKLPPYNADFFNVIKPAQAQRFIEILRDIPSMDNVIVLTTSENRHVANAFPPLRPTPTVTPDSNVTEGKTRGTIRETGTPQFTTLA